MNPNEATKHFLTLIFFSSLLLLLISAVRCHFTITVVEEPGETFSTSYTLKTSGIRSLKCAGRCFPLRDACASQKKNCWFALRFLSRVNPLCGLRYSELTWTDVEGGKQGQARIL